MAKASDTGLTVQNMRDSIKTTFLMAKASITGLTVQNMRDSGKTT